MLTQELEVRLMNALTQIKHSSLLEGDIGVCIFLFMKGGCIKIHFMAR